MFDELIEKRLRPLAAAFVASGLERVRIAGGETEIEFSRVGGRAAAHSSLPQLSEPGTAGEGAAAYDVVTADLVGRVRFLRPPVAVGAVVEEDRELASIESLGIRNPVRSRGAGRVAVVYVEEGQAVDYGAPLFAIDRSGR